MNQEEIIYTRTKKQTWDQVSQQMWDKTIVSGNVQINEQVDAALHYQVWNHVWNQVNDQVRNQIRDKIIDQVKG